MDFNQPSKFPHQNKLLATVSPAAEPKEKRVDKGDRPALFLPVLTANRPLHAIRGAYEGITSIFQRNVSG